MTEQNVKDQYSLTNMGLDMFDPASIARPHQFYTRLREKAPLAWSPQTQSWVLSRYEDVRYVLRTPDKFSSQREAEGGQLIQGRKDIIREEVAPPGTLTMLGADRPDHTRLRKLLSMDFTPNKIRHLQPHVEALCEDMLAGSTDGDHCEVVKNLAEPLPATLIAELLGIPADLGIQFKAWSDAATTPLSPEATDAEVNERNEQIVAFRRYLQT